VKDKNLDDILDRAAKAPHEVDPSVLDRISNSIAPSVQPVRPLPAAWLLTASLVLICAAVALSGAAILGFHGVHARSAAQIATILPALGIFAWIAASASVAAMTPGGARRISAPWILTIGILALLTVFAVSFHDYHVDRFVPQGLVCLTAGILHAIPTGAATWWVLRRGFAVDPFAAGLVTGTLASLAGVAMLELHCANLQALHILVWHTAVVPTSALIGALLARGFHRR
jgi:hypothetical protein